MRFQAGSLVILFAAMALAAPVPYDSESTSLDRRAFSREEEIIDLLRRADNAVRALLLDGTRHFTNQTPPRFSPKFTLSTVYHEANHQREAAPNIIVPRALSLPNGLHPLLPGVPCPLQDLIKRRVW
ncbi:hypothetical protein M408DRAFT_264648 [Serendipita vermifera MAFF 305830]|uniref:Uncharacterized protein n=1 Tax=Serendipita vermifera MAFF 305830 TaxID=933852 RepID=A0A0C3AF00_SERVB|nr:hypothetical protein M408DRAFT_264648 [Serendipita vermifera MAFF 305830]